MGVSAIGALKAVAAGPLRSQPAASSLPAMSCEVMSAMAAPLAVPTTAGRRHAGLSLGAADLRTGVQFGPVVARGRTGVDRRAAGLGELEVPARRALDVPAFTDRELDQRAQPLVAAGQFMCVRPGTSPAPKDGGGGRRQRGNTPS